MTKVIFKNLEKSDLVKEVVLDKMNLLIEKFPELTAHSISVTLSMDNSKIKAGPDEFGVKVQIKGEKFDGLIVEKKSMTVYLALAEVNEAMLELINRRIDKLRVKTRTQSRKIKYQQEIQSEQIIYDDLANK